MDHRYDGYSRAECEGMLNALNAMLTVSEDPDYISYTQRRRECLIRYLRSLD